MNFEARVWKFPDNINTDLILPNRAFYLTPAEQVKFVFSANRPGWVDEVQSGDILIGGRNFGMGSSRPAARSLRNLKLGCLVAESINGLFFRNSVNFGFPALECPGIEAAFDEGDVAKVSFEDYTVRNERTVAGGRRVLGAQERIAAALSSVEPFRSSFFRERERLRAAANHA
jgi:3-isopropylmalate/(R)-2-methylmalate dehydratase small subunit